MIGDTKVKKIDVRVIAATSRNLKDEVNAGAFRKDLFYRLNVLLIRLPLLRERTEDIPLLCQYFIDRFNIKVGKNVKGIAPAAILVDMPRIFVPPQAGIHKRPVRIEPKIAQFRFNLKPI